MKHTVTLLLASSLFTVMAAHLPAAEPKRVIVCTVTTGFRHSSIGEAEKTLQKLADETKAFTIVDFARQPTAEPPKRPEKPKEPGPNADDKAKAKYAEDTKKYEAELAKWTPEMESKAKVLATTRDNQMKESMLKLTPQKLSDQHIDGVIFANTTGDLPLLDKEGFIKWIEDGHAFMAMHSGSDTFHGFPGYTAMLQGEFKTHGAQVPADLIAGDTKHPANGGIGETWNIAQEEMYEFKEGSHDRSKVHVLWFLRHPPQDKNKAEYAGVSWCRMDGKGRVFYTSLGHREDLWSDDPNLKDRKNPVEISRQYQAHILGGIKWALGLAEGSAAPNPEVK